MINMKYIECASISYMTPYTVLPACDYREGAAVGAHAINTEVHMESPDLIFLS